MPPKNKLKFKNYKTMKKILFAVLALAAMASCSKEYTVDYNKQAIAFGEAFVDNGTRADYSSGNEIATFKVYGTLTGSDNTGGNTVQIFNGADVARPDDLPTGYNESKAWNCTTTQYWVPSASYKFAAIVDGAATTTTGLPETIPFTVTDGDGDLLYAEATATTNENATPSVNPVAFTFNHLLSKIQFTIANTMAEGYSIQVTNITVAGVTDKGVYTVNGGTWDKADDAATVATPLTFGTTAAIASADSAVASMTHQILPVQQTLTVAIAYDIYFNDGTGAKKIASTTKTGEISQSFVKNTVYNITAEINATEIQFSVKSVNGFATPNVEDNIE